MGAGDQHSLEAVLQLSGQFVLNSEDWLGNSYIVGGL